MFIVSVLSFIAGIYVEALSNFPIKFLLLPLISLVVIIPLFFKRYAKPCIFLILLCFFLAGMMRVGIITNSYQNNEIDDEIHLFKVKVIESNKTIKVLRISSPEDYKSMNVILMTEMEVDVGDVVHIYGRLKELVVTYKNPYVISWRWIKRLEGINFEIKGDILDIKKGSRLIDKIRRFIKEKIEDSGSRQQGIIKALTLGDRTSIDDETRLLFQKTGTSHILAISGLHIGIITGFFFFIMRCLLGRKRSLALSGRDKRYAAIITVIFPILFMWLSGANISTVRATIMVLIFLWAIFFQKQRDIINTVFITALIILVIYPHSLFAPSFQLSFLSVIFIILIGQRVYPLIKINFRPIRWFLMTIITSFAAIIGTIPPVLFHFYGMNFLSVLHNLISIPLICSISLPLTLLGTLLPFGEPLIAMAGRIIDFNIDILKTLDFGYIYPFIRPNLLETLLFYTLILCVLYIDRKIVVAIACFVIVPVAAIYTIYAMQDRFSERLCINFIDVGLGESILIEVPKGRRILVDGGSNFKGGFDIGKNIITPILLSKKILTLDYVINTHPHGDHIGGLLYILKHFKVKGFATGGYFIGEPVFFEVIETLKDRKIGFYVWNKGDEVSMDGLKMIILNPDRGYRPDNLNNASLVMKIVYKERSFLLTGDIERDIEEGLIMKNAPLRSDVLKVPHHGSNNSSSLSFLIAVRPGLAVLSVGRGIRGLPGREALNRYKRLSIPVVSTLENGFISVCTNGIKISYKTYR
ncbi:MAG: DNA internalization-related competence protein ComEC/Rec2 [Syntrophorhabdaceae bacterium]|nr:DNA internalization-related competence protein ComEC/Rec2 [Syntrophorhabdaceae bacterium]